MDQTKISLDYLLLLLYYTRSCVYFYNFFVILSQSLLTERYSEMPDLVVRHSETLLKRNSSRIFIWIFLINFI